MLAKLRRQKGISQKKAAEELGISPALLSHYENGIRECGLDFLLRLAEYYSVSCDYLLGKTEVKNPVLYESEPSAFAIDRILKTAKDHSPAAYDLLSNITEVNAYHMARALCQTATRGEAFTFEYEQKDYGNLCAAASAGLYAKMSELGKEKKRLPVSVRESTEKVIKNAEKTLKKYI
jgi:transcriptional regulator with XRE-family HTH domain